MWEILTGQEPYADMHCGAIIGTYVASYFLYSLAEANLVSTVRVLSFDVFVLIKRGDCEQYVETFGAGEM